MHGGHYHSGHVETPSKLGRARTLVRLRSLTLTPPPPPLDRPPAERRLPGCFLPLKHRHGYMCTGTLQSARARALHWTSWSCQTSPGSPARLGPQQLMNSFRGRIIKIKIILPIRLDLMPVSAQVMAQGQVRTRTRTRHDQELLFHTWPAGGTTDQPPLVQL